ncbi:hypothetical protein CsatB_015514 [Cannabis sativa]
MGAIQHGGPELVSELHHDILSDLLGSLTLLLLVILASWSPTASPLQLDASGRKLPLQFKIESGTSMSCPHVTAVVALLRSTYPNWSPAAIKSALVTTASLEHDYGQSIVAEGAPYKFADPFDYGGGHVNPNKAIYPSLIFDLVTSDYVHFLCTMGYTNTAINLVTRTVTNVGPVNSIYIPRVQTPFGVSVKVNPSVLVFNSSVKKLKINLRKILLWKLVLGRWLVLM